MKELLPLTTVGAQFAMSSSDFEVVNVGENQLRVSPIHGGSTRIITFSTLLSLMRRGAIQITYTPPNASDPNELGLRSGLTKGQLAGLNRKLHYVRGIHRLTIDPCSQTQIKSHISDLAKDLGDQDPPGASTIAGWVKRWLDGGRKDAALLPPLKPSRAAHNKISKDVFQIVTEAIQEVYLTRQRNPKKAVEAEVLLRITERNERAEVKLEMPSSETIRKIINGVDQFQADVARRGALYAKRRHRAAGKAFIAAEPLELTMADGQIMDLILVDKEGLGGVEIGRPFLTAIIDVYSRCVIAAYISLAPFSGATLLRAISMAVVADGKRPRGIMSKIIVDNGSDYRHAGFIRFCADCDIAVEPCPPRMPNGKAIIERFFRTLNDGLIHRLPGTTFSNPKERGDYQSQKMARLTLEQLRKHLEVWVDEYHLNVHSSLMRAPIDVWTEATQP